MIGPWATNHSRRNSATRSRKTPRKLAALPWRRPNRRATCGCSGLSRRQPARPDCDGRLAASSSKQVLTGQLVWGYAASLRSTMLQARRSTPTLARSGHLVGRAGEGAGIPIRIASVSTRPTDPGRDLDADQRRQRGREIVERHVARVLPGRDRDGPSGSAECAHRSCTACRGSRPAPGGSSTARG